MLAIVLKSCPLSSDGVTARYLEPDPERPVEIPDDLAPGLAAEGWIKPATPKQAKKAPALALGQPTN